MSEVISNSKIKEILKKIESINSQLQSNEISEKEFFGHTLRFFQEIISYIPLMEILNEVSDIEKVKFHYSLKNKQKTFKDQASSCLSYIKALRPETDKKFVTKINLIKKYLTKEDFTYSLISNLNDQFYDCAAYLIQNKYIKNHDLTKIADFDRNGLLRRFHYDFTYRSLEREIIAIERKQQQEFYFSWVQIKKLFIYFYKIHELQDSSDSEKDFINSYGFNSVNETLEMIFNKNEKSNIHFKSNDYKMYIGIIINKITNLYEQGIFKNQYKRQGRSIIVSGIYQIWPTTGKFINLQNQREKLSIAKASKPFVLLVLFAEKYQRQHDKTNYKTIVISLDDLKTAINSTNYYSTKRKPSISSNKSFMKNIYDQLVSQFKLVDIIKYDVENLRFYMHLDSK